MDSTATFFEALSVFGTMKIHRLEFASISSKRGGLAPFPILYLFQDGRDFSNNFIFSGPHPEPPSNPGTIAMAKSAKPSPGFWYFEATTEELNTLASLGDFEKLLIAKLVHTLRLGVYFYQRRHTDAEVSIKSTTASTKACQKYVLGALKNCIEGDKFFPLRLTAPSMHQITQLLPLDTPPSAVLVFKICILRTFGVGSQDAINDLAKSLSTTEPDLKNLDTVIQGVGKGKDKISRIVYGRNLQIVRASVPEMLEKFWAFAKEIIKDKESTTPLPTFEEIQDILCSASIPTIKRHGLLAWLITSDLVEWNICKEPEIEDLDAHISTKKAGQLGPTKALKRIEDGYKKTNGDEERGYST